jgi:hypothetical protein
MSVAGAIDAVVFLFGGAGLLSLLAFTALILVPSLSSFGRGWEKATAAILSLFVLIALLALGFGLGVIIVYYWNDISGWFG